MRTDLERGEIYSCKVYFENPDRKGTFTYKKRPVLILENKSYLIETAEITSHSVRKWDTGDYRIRDWKEAGLKKPSTVRLTLRVGISPHMLDKKIGELSVRDEEEVEKILRQIG